MNIPWKDDWCDRKRTVCGTDEIVPRGWQTGKPGVTEWGGRAEPRMDTNDVVVARGRIEPRMDTNGHEFL